MKKTSYEIFNIKDEETYIILKFNKYIPNFWGNSNAIKSYSIKDDGTIVINLK
ncbi:hypothetical protein SHM_11100 [Spiroplasma ixodetis]|uniref:Uncharacterized protein n=1 Tax=Spiroplasma ixodetis TaxID=2141 RepID=A0ABM8BUF5_9MOLU|nr:hypothetical protein SHM_11100 [Spiroplasma ixodetis]